MAVSGTGQVETPQSLVTPAFAGFSSIAESDTKVVLTTCLTTDRKIFDFLPHRGIMAETEYPGVVQLIERAVWDREAESLSLSTRTKIPLKSLISEGFFLSLITAAQDLSCLMLSIYRDDFLGRPPRRDNSLYSRIFQESVLNYHNYLLSRKMSLLPFWLSQRFK